MDKIPGVTIVQLLYYFACLLILIIGIFFFTSSVVPFFRDCQSIIMIIMNVGIWMTPILWNINDIQNRTVRIILSLNPVHYIVNGYRDSFMNGYWIWEHQSRHCEYRRPVRHLFRLRYLLCYVHVQLVTSSSRSNGIGLRGRDFLRRQQRMAA